MLQVKDLHVRYHNRSKEAVPGISFSIEAGEFVLLVGDSACGKSTAMQAVCGFIPTIIPAEMRGEVRFDGEALRDPARIARIASMVQQDPEGQFCTETVDEEVAFGPENFNFPADRIEELIGDSLALVNASHLRERKLSTLSGGEKQKVAIASMLAIEPKLLILDEPTANLDPRGISEVIDAVAEMRKKREITVIVVEHRIRDFSSLATRMLMMEGGLLRADLKKGTAEFGAAVRSSTAPHEYQKVAAREGVIASVSNLSHEISGKTILDDLNFEIRDGAIIALMGENGAGKTTLLRHITGLVQPQRGSVKVFDHVMGAGKASRPWEIGEHVGFVFQNPNHQIFETTVEKEILFATKNFGAPFEGTESAVEEFIKKEGVVKDVHPYCLSFGQKRRLNIVSASSHGPKLLLLDEPLAGQDPKNARRIAGLLASLQRKGKTCVIVTHDPEFARAFCTDALVLKAGRLTFAGSIAELTDDRLEALLPEAKR